jgi:hypothetical protein
MKRRDFFKGLFGAAAVAAIPKPVFEQLVKEPEPEKMEIAGTFEPEYTPSSSAPVSGTPIMSRTVLMVYDDDKIIAHSIRPSLNVHRELPIFKSDVSDMIAFQKMPMSWTITADDITFYEDVREIIQSGKLYKAVISEAYGAENLVATGEVMLTSFYLADPMSEYRHSESAEFTGSGQVNMIIKKG